MDFSKLVREFYHKHGVKVNEKPTLNVAGKELRKKLHREETEELARAIDENDLIEIADALGDIAYVLHGTALEYGIPLDAVFAEVHRSNMTKEGARRGDGKIIKGPTFEPPRIAEILVRAGALTGGAA
jgi:predicted HAD superfamily Cof-like phosphohydrolase